MDGSLAGLRTFAVSYIPPILTALSVLAGMALIFKAMFELAKAGDERSGQNDGIWGRIGLRILIGAALLQFSSTMSEVVTLVFGAPPQNYRNAMAYIPISGANANYWRNVLDLVLTWVVIIGWISAFRGFLKWNSAASGAPSSGGDPFWQGLWHILGGALAINIGGVFNAVLR
jgi:hypothetical protein